MPFGKKRVLDHIINRCLAFNIEPIVCTSTHESDDIIYDIAIENNGPDVSRDKIIYRNYKLFRKLVASISCLVLLKAGRLFHILFP